MYVLDRSKYDRFIPSIELFDVNFPIVWEKQNKFSRSILKYSISILEKDLLIHE